MIRTKHIALIILSVILVYACSEIFLTDISKEEVILLSPPDSAEYKDDYNILFWWEPVTDATGYNLAVVTPNFNSIMKKVLDTNITQTEFKYLLYPADFEWSVMAYNEEFSTQYFIRGFKIDTAERPQKVVMINIGDTVLITRSDTLTFNWKSDELAEEYAVEIFKGSQEIFDSHIKELSITFPDVNENAPWLDDGRYTFLIKAVSEDNQYSEEYTTFEILVDRTNPSKPIPKNPRNNDTVIIADEPNIEWITNQDQGSTIYDSLYVYYDSTNTNPELYRVNDGIFPIYNEGVYYWKVKSIDLAGNKSEFSDIWKFTAINEK